MQALTLSIFLTKQQERMEAESHHALSLTFSLCCDAIYISISAKNSDPKHNYNVGREGGWTRREDV